MTGYDIFKKATVLLGYTDSAGEVPSGDGLLKRAIVIINQIISDLGGTVQLLNLTDEVKLLPKALEALPYGTAMLLGISDGDGTGNQLFCELYNAKRAAALNHSCEVIDVLPTDDGGVYG